MMRYLPSDKSPYHVFQFVEKAVIGQEMIVVVGPDQAVVKDNETVGRFGVFTVDVYTN